MIVTVQGVEVRSRAAGTESLCDTPKRDRQKAKNRNQILVMSKVSKNTALPTDSTYLRKIGKQLSATVKVLVEQMGQRIEKLEQQVTQLLSVQQQLLEKINRTSKNSSSPPSVDLPNAPKKQRKQKSGKKRGGQKGHEGH